jgi:hypothetical protein
VCVCLRTNACMCVRACVRVFVYVYTRAPMCVQGICMFNSASVPADFLLLQCLCVPLHVCVRVNVHVVCMRMCVRVYVCMCV